MMKVFGRRALLVSFLFCQLSNQNAISKPVRDFNVDSCRLWREWQKDFLIEKNPGPKSIQLRPCPNLIVDIVDPVRISGRAAQTRGNKIQISKLIQGSNLDSVFRHELAHVFIGNHFSGLSLDHVYFQEILALAISGDDQRIVQEKKLLFPTAASAKIYLIDRMASRSYSMNALEAAISRLLIDPGARARVLQQLKDQKISTQSVLANLVNQSGLAKFGPIAYALKDNLTNEVLEMEGPTERLLPIGSILKPVLLRDNPELMSLVPARDDATWDCPRRQMSEMGRPWDWRLALVRSCNGFFIDQKNKISGFQNIAHDLKFFVGNRFQNKLNIYSIVGLLPTLQMSTLEVANLYAWFVQNNKEFIQPLRDTARIGTLSAQPESEWFVKRNIALKSGTVRGNGSEPLVGWIVAWIPNVDGQYRYTAVIQSSGASGFQLLRELKRKLQNEPALKAFDETDVQILGLLPENRIQFSCSPQDYFIVGKEIKEKISNQEIRSGQSFRCLKGPLIANFQNNQKAQIHRAYWGEIRYASQSIRPRLVSDSMPSTLKQKRARLGSSFRFHTSERSYVARTLHAELAAGRKETMKALAYVIRSNSRIKRHDGQPNCDTTHCQVFRSGDDEPAKDLLLRKRLKPYFSAFDAIVDLPIKSNEFLEFSLGGSAPWSQEISRDKISLFAQAKITGADWFQRIGEDVVLASRRISCESFRSAFHFLSCPSRGSIQGQKIIFTGFGEGHGRGIDITAAESMAAQGRSYREILTRFYPDLF